MRFGASSSALSVLTLALPFIPTSLSQVTVYTGLDQPSGTDANPTATDGGPGGFVTNLPAYDTLRLTGPAPIEPPLTGYSIGIPSPDLLSPDRPLSRPIRGNLLGFSVELSVADQVLGTTGQVLKPQFLNYLANIQQRAGVGPQVRVGGNSQEGSSIFVDGTSNGRLIEKIKVSEYAVSTEAMCSCPLVILTDDVVDGNTNHQLRASSFRCHAQHLPQHRHGMVLWSII